MNIVFDTETTGREASTIIEAAWIILGEGFIEISEYVERFNPAPAIIEFGAMATHHILPHELEDCRPVSAFTLPHGLKYMTGHNIDFDWEVAGKPEVKRICTLALSRWLWPDLDGHSQSALYYWLQSRTPGDMMAARKLLKGAHSALIDVRICHSILTAIVYELRNRGYKVDTPEHLWDWSELARIPIKMSFGKHKGERIADLPQSYKTWLLKQEDMDPYVKIAVQGGRKVVGGLTIS